MLLLHSAPWAWTVTLKSEPQGRFLNVQLVFVVWQLSRCPSPAIWARKLKLPSTLDQPITAVLMLQSYCLDVIAGEQGAGKPHRNRENLNLLSLKWNIKQLEKLSQAHLWWYWYAVQADCHTGSLLQWPRPCSSDHTRGLLVCRKLCLRCRKHCARSQLLH